MSHLNVNGVDKPLDHVYVKARTENLFDRDSIIYPTGTTIKYFPIKVPDGTYTLSTNFPDFDTKDIFFIAGNASSGASSSSNGVSLSTTRTRTAENGYVTVAMRYNETRANPADYDIMLNLGTTAKPYEPYLITKEAWEARTRVTLHGLTNPLCGIGTYKDTLDLSTGTLTRYVKKLVLTGEEVFTDQDVDGVTLFRLAMNYTADKMFGAGRDTMLCSHYTIATSRSDCAASDESMSTYNTSNDNRLMFHDSSCASSSEFQSYLAAQYAAGHPVTVWYVLATPEAEQITLPSNLTGIVEGYLTQDSTPSPTSPVYPTANGTLEQGGTYSLDTGAYAIAWGRADTFTGTNSISARCYGLPVKSWEIDGNSQQSGVPSPDNIIMPEFVGDYDYRSGNVYLPISDNSQELYDPNAMSESTYSCGVSVNAQYYYVSSAPIVSVNTSSDNPNTILIPIEPNTKYLFKFKTANGIVANTDYLRIGLIDNFVENEIAYSIRNFVGLSSVSKLEPNKSYELSIENTNKRYIIIQTRLIQNQKITDISIKTIIDVITLGNVQTVRRVKKLVLTGEETGIFTDGGLGYIRIIGGLSEQIAPYSDKLIGTTAGSAGRPVFSIRQSPLDSTSPVLSIKADADFPNAAAFRSWLAENQITVWYVLADPETAIVNEPLAKIDTYADTLTSEQAGITIPTTDGNNTISVDTALAPSKFEVKVHAKPI